jgi:hypothetical protein
MSIQSRHQLENTRKKLQILEDRCKLLESTAQESTMARELTVRSLKRFMNQMKEEIARFESRVSVRSDGR